MKQRIISIIIILGISLLFFFSLGKSQATSPSLSPSETILDKQKKIEILKEKIATKVAEIREKEKKATSGKVKSINSGSLILETKENQEITVSFLEDVVVYLATDTGKTEIKDKKIKEEDFISVFGYYDKSRKILSAKYIYKNLNFEKHLGKIANIDKENYTITLKMPEGELLVDIETYSKIFSLSKERKLTKSGFSKLSVGDFAHLLIKSSPGKKEENRVSALRLFHFAPSMLAPSFSQEASPSPKLK